MKASLQRDTFAAECSSLRNGRRLLEESSNLAGLRRICMSQSLDRESLAIHGSHPTLKSQTTCPVGYSSLTNGAIDFAKSDSLEQPQNPHLQNTVNIFGCPMTDAETLLCDGLNVLLILLHGRIDPSCHLLFPCGSWTFGSYWIDPSNYALL